MEAFLDHAVFPEAQWAHLPTPRRAAVRLDPARPTNPVQTHGRGPGRMAPRMERHAKNKERETMSYDTRHSLAWDNKQVGTEQVTHALAPMFREEEQYRDMLAGGLEDEIERTITGFAQ